MYANFNLTKIVFLNKNVFIIKGFHVQFVVVHSLSIHTKFCFGWCTIYRQKERNQMLNLLWLLFSGLLDLQNHQIFVKTVHSVKAAKLFLTR